MSTTFESFIQEPNNSALLGRLPYNDVVLQQTRTTIVKNWPIHTTLLLIGRTKEAGRDVEVYACISQNPKPKNDLPDVYYSTLGSDGYLDTRITKDALFSDDNFRFDKIFGTNKPSHAQLPHVAKYHLLWSLSRQGRQLSSQIRLNATFKSFVLSYCKVFPVVSRATRPEVFSPFQASTPSNTFSNRQTPSTSMEGKRLGPSNTANDNAASSSFVFATPQGVTDYTPSQHRQIRESTQTMNSETPPLMRLLGAKCRISGAIEAGEKKDKMMCEEITVTHEVIKAAQEEIKSIQEKIDSMQKKIMSLHEGRNELKKEQAAHHENYETLNEEERKLWSTLPDKERTLYEMIRRTSNIDNQKQEEKRRKGSL
ncbi:hypothetical protein ACJQWK_09413 [Exserohilum turcicum]